MARAAPSLGTRRPSSMARRDGNNCLYNTWHGRTGESARWAAPRRALPGQGSGHEQSPKRSRSYRPLGQHGWRPPGSMSRVTRGRLRHGTTLWVSPGTPAKGVTQDTTALAMANATRRLHRSAEGTPRPARRWGGHEASGTTAERGWLSDPDSRVRDGCDPPWARGVCLASLQTCANPTPDPPVRWPKVESYIVRAAAAAQFRFLFLPVWQKKSYFCISAQCCWVSFSPDLSKNTSSLQGKTDPR